MKKYVLFLSLSVCISGALFAQTSSPQVPPKGHPNPVGVGWKPLFARDLSDAGFPKGVWTMDDGGVLTASADKAIWSPVPYEDFILDLLFKTADGTNSGVVVHASDTTNWIPNSVEIQIADDYAKQWADSPKNWQCAAFFGHQAAIKQEIVKKPGEWNRYTITCLGQMIYVVLNNQLVNTIDLSKFTTATSNPDGSPVPEWLNKAPADLPLRGYIGLQGKHAGAPIYFRNLRIKAL